MFEGLSTCVMVGSVALLGCGSITGAGRPTAATNSTSETPATDLHGSDRDKMRTTVVRLRNVGSAMYAWRERNVPPGQPAALEEFDVGALPTISAQELEELLVPDFMDALPRVDGWDRPIEYYLSREPSAAPCIAIRSSGADGSWSGPAYTPGPFPSEDADNDVVWADGYFVTWPQPPESG